MCKGNSGLNFLLVDRWNLIHTIGRNQGEEILGVEGVGFIIYSKGGDRFRNVKS